MTLSSGNKLGPYEIVAPIGAGGMGEVYRARDTKLGRDVAIKVLPEEFARDTERMARFQREARLLASLHHTNIATIHGLEDSGNTRALVMELAEGPTLADRIRQGPIPIEEALPIARQLADALEYAHEHGIIHRDLKPANVKVAGDDTVKILDFGLAKALETDLSATEPANSPTLSHLATQAGVLLGTAAYMSPEQAKAKPVDRRADIWAFGCVLYEMLTGKMAFHGDAVTDTLAAVLKNEPDWSQLPGATPMRVRVLLQRCLQKDPKQRLRDMGDARISLDEVLSGAPEGAPLTVTSSPFWRRAMPWAAGLLAVAIASAAVWNLKPSPPEQRQVTRLYDELPKDQEFGSIYDSNIAVSHDGRQLVYGTQGGLYLRSMDELDARLIPGTGGNPERPFFSPDDRWIGYFSRSDNQLKKIAISGGAPLPLTDAAGSRGSMFWGTDDTIVYGQLGKGIMRVSANGGTPEAIVKEETAPLLHPQILPDGKSVLFTLGNAGLFKIVVQSLQSGERKELFAGDTSRYLQTGHIVYALGNNLLAVPFDVKTLKVAGGPVPVVEGVFRVLGPPQYAVSDAGTLVYLPGTGTELKPQNVQRNLLWVDRHGKEEPINAPPNVYSVPRISPDGSRIALAVMTGGSIDIWIWDLVRKTLPRLTFDADLDTMPLWTADGKRIAYLSRRQQVAKVYWRTADGTGNDELLSDRVLFPASWSRDGKTLVAEEANFENLASGNLFDIGVLSLEGDHKWRPLLKGKYNEVAPRISPDGRWMAYTSNESGRYEVYVRPFPDVEKGGRWQVSTVGGDSPLWSPDGQEIYYRSGEAVMAVPVKTDPIFSPETPKVLFRGTYFSFGHNFPQFEISPWDISPDGRRFLMMKEAGSGAAAALVPRKINIVLNWLEELKRRVPTGMH